MASHPKGLYMLSAVEVWERFSYYGMRAILSLFMISVLFFSVPFSSSIYGAYTGFVYLTPILGGYIADRYWGNRKSIIVGGVLMAIGQFVLAISAAMFTGVKITSHSMFIFNTQEILFILGLVFLIFGNGFFKPNISSMISFLYEEGDSRLDSAFTIFYMAVNIGSFLAPLVTGLLVGEGHPELFKWGFLATGIGMVIGLIIFVLLKKKYLNDVNGNPIGVTPNSVKGSSDLPLNKLDEALLKKVEFKEDIIKKEKEKLKKLSRKEKEALLNGPLTKVEKQRIAVIFVIAFFAIFFWSAFEQAGVSLTYFTTQHVSRVVSTGFIVPPGWFQSLDPLFIIIFAPVFAVLWPILRKRGIEPSIPTKIALGLFILAIGFLILTIPGSMVDAGMTGVSMLWMVITYLILAYAELCISPTGQSVVAKLSPVKFSSILMAIWLASTAVSNFLAGKLSTLYPTPDNPTPYLLGVIKIGGYADFFLMFTVMAVVAGIIIFLIRKPINKWMNGIR